MLPQEELPDYFECVVEGHAEVAGATVEVHRYRWGAHQDVVVTPTHGYLDVVLTERAPAAMGRYLGGLPTHHRRYGSTIFIPAGFSLHSQWEAGGQRSVCCELDHPIFSEFKERQWDDRDLTASLDVRSRFIREAMLRLSAEVLSPGFAGPILIESLCTAVAVELHRYFRGEPARLPAASGLSRAILDHISERIRESRGILPSIGELAAETDLSARHLSRLFHRAMGQTIGSYAAELKLAQAKEYLSKRRMGIKEISFQCGFTSVSAFSAAFHRRVGITPRRYRQMALN